MATYSSTLAWRIPWTEELGGLQSLGSQRIEHVRSDFTGPHGYIGLAKKTHLGFPIRWSGKP